MQGYPYYLLSLINLNVGVIGDLSREQRSKVVKTHSTDIPAAALTDSHCTCLLFLLTHNQDVRNFRQTKFANFIVDFLTAQILFYSITRIEEFLINLVSVVCLGIRNGGNRYLSRCESRRKGAGVVL